MKILVLDNYDSFTYNLVHLMREVQLPCEFTLDVVRNDRITVQNCSEYDKIVFSPGPGIPGEAGIMKEVIAAYTGSASMLGVCLGHQAIAEVFGASLKNLDRVFHGVATDISVISDDYILRDLPSAFTAGRYHSWVVEKDALPVDLIVTAVDAEDNIMAFRHKTYDIHGVQFHPESILTPQGNKILESFMRGNR